MFVCYAVLMTNTTDTQTMISFFEAAKGLIISEGILHARTAERVFAALWNSTPNKPFTDRIRATVAVELDDPEDVVTEAIRTAFRHVG